MEQKMPTIWWARLANGEIAIYKGTKEEALKKAEIAAQKKNTYIVFFG